MKTWVLTYVGRIDTAVILVRWQRLEPRVARSYSEQSYECPVEREEVEWSGIVEIRHSDDSVCITGPTVAGVSCAEERNRTGRERR